MGFPRNRVSLVSRQSMALHSSLCRRADVCQYRFAAQENDGGHSTLVIVRITMAPDDSRLTTRFSSHPLLTTSSVGIDATAIFTSLLLPARAIVGTDAAAAMFPT